MTRESTVVLILSIGHIESYGADNVNCASDLIAQYTTRQEYRYSEFSQANGRRKEIDQTGRFPKSIFDLH